MRSLAVVSLLSGVLLAHAVRAGDGAIEINQASVLAAGAFPYVITQPGKYVLTGNLTLPTADTTGIQIQARGVTLDLNGFGIIGPVTCLGDGTTRNQNTSCSAAGSGNGISVGSGATAVIRNGFVRGMGASGVSIDSSLTSIVESVVVEENASHGINLYQGRVVESAVRFNGGNGIHFCNCGGGGTSQIENNVLERNRGIGIQAGRGTVQNNYVFNNGSHGVFVNPSGANTGNVVGNTIQGNSGNAINSTGGVYRANTLTSNLQTSGHQVVGTITDGGGNFCSPAC